MDAKQVCHLSRVASTHIVCFSSPVCHLLKFSHCTVNKRYDYPHPEWVAITTWQHVLRNKLFVCTWAPKGHEGASKYVQAILSVPLLLALCKYGLMVNIHT